MLGVLMAFMGAIGGATAQTDIPPFGPVFLQEEVATVDITMDPDSLDAMLFGDVGSVSYTHLTLPTICSV